ncbi:amylo-alpha-1,6-glucosidase [Erythrobacter sp. 3-20A1M]|uniref:amylo-alpha-1,6-glucosidase n=1 Tax=Erythrobacter sp. 3-20A1M TaxID=2653850 RepID=UPI001BFC1AD7|nr:amylo-alpha-1,6-glucosidase [Erythrobacter sp. 3-20A1M]QWC57170.1 amylo-alpha-1,6-glucosidase [Erythrobacter sp. 3-20A1M]
MEERAILSQPEPAGPEDQHQVQSASSIQEQELRAVKHGDAFALFDQHGDIAADETAPEGVYYRDTRHLSFWRMTICGRTPMLLGSAIDDRVDALIVDLTNGNLTNRAGKRIPKEVLHFGRIKFLHDGKAYERLAVRNFDDCEHRFSIEFTLGSDFRDMFEVRGAHREKRGKQQEPRCNESSVEYAYTGLDDIVRRTALSFDPVPDAVSSHRVRFEVVLAPGERKIFYTMAAFGDAELEEPARAYLEAYRALREGRRDALESRPVIGSSNTSFDTMVARSIADVTTLTTQTPQGPAAYAGIPWYCTLFGRDSLITALQMLWYDPSLARGTLLRLAELQARTDDPVADAEVGKILHETRHGEMANTGEVPFRHYYGSVDSTPLFVHLAGEYFRRTGDEDTIDRLWPHLEAATGWIDRSGDRDGDGFFEYGRRNENGLRNQGWKDSHDAISHADGRLAEGPIALVEMQAYVYGAWQAMGDLAAARGNGTAAGEWWDRAAELKSRFADTFFDSEMGCYILALDGEKEPCRVVSSNAGHALLTGIATKEHAEAVAARLLKSDCFSGWGIRTLSRREKRYNPMSYHNGSIWPHDNALIAAGFARYGLQEAVNKVFSALFEASFYFDQQRFPELFCGFGRKFGRGPTLYPVACAPQAWSSAAPIYMIQAMLGMSIEAPDQVRFRKPRLPEVMSQLSLDRLTCGAESVDLDVREMGPATSVFVRRGDEALDISVMI